MRERGFSFLELIVVVAIIAIAGSVAAPEMSSWNCRRQVSNDLAEVLMIVQSAKEIAVSSGEAQGVAVLKTNPTVSFRQYRSEYCGASARDTGTETLEKLRLSGPSDNFCFRPDGTATANSNNYGWYLEGFCGAEQILYRVQISQATGLISVLQKSASQNSWIEL